MDRQFEDQCEDETQAKVIAAAAEQFADDDPRRAPATGEEDAEAKAGAGDRQRWHRQRTDWFAIRLQYGRGIGVFDLCRMFSIGETTLRRRARQENWRPLMTGRDMRSLARRVWLTGLARGGHDEGSLARLAVASEWRPIAEPPNWKWTPKDPDGEPPALKAIGKTPEELQEERTRKARQRLDEALAALDAGDERRQ